MVKPITSSSPSPNPINDISEKYPSIPFRDNISVALKQTWKMIHTPGKWPLTVLKATVVIPLALTITAATLALVCLGILCHIVALPFVLTSIGWNKQSAKDYIGSSIKDLAAFAFSTMTSLIDGTQFDPSPMPAGQKATKTPVLLVHGYMHSSSAWHFIRRRLEAEGIRTYTINLGSPFNSISKDFAHKVKEKALKIAKDSGRDDLLLVGHSMGGLVSSEYATTLAPPGTVKGVVTLGSPMKGSKSAKIPPGRCAKEMHHHSPFVKALDAKVQNALGITFFNFSSKTDLLVRPIKMSGLHAKHILSHEFRSCGHMTYLYSPEVADSIFRCYKALH